MTYRVLPRLYLSDGCEHVFTDFPRFLFIAFQYPQLNLSQLLKSSWVRTGMSDLHNVLGTVGIKSLGRCIEHDADFLVSES